MSHLILFFSCFFTVFALGFQSLNVNGGHYLAAAATSFIIAAGHIALYKLMPEASASEIAAYLFGGPLGIVSSMWVHRRTIGREKPRKSNVSPIRKKTHLYPAGRHRPLYAKPPAPVPPPKSL